jgi:hypothetical protein
MRRITERIKGDELIQRGGFRGAVALYGDKYGRQGMKFTLLSYSGGVFSVSCAMESEEKIEAREENGLAGNSRS